MKKSYKRILIFEIIFIFVLIFNCFNSNMLSVYKTPLFLFLSSIFFSFLLRPEKDRYPYKKDAFLQITECFIVFMLLYYISGIFITFVKFGNFLSPYGIGYIILPLVLTIITKEYLRYLIIKKSERSKLLIVLSVIVFIFLDISTTLSIGSLVSKYTIFKYIALTILPSITTNIFLTYLCYNFGYKPAIYYMLLMSLYPYILPIVPNPSEYIKSIIDFLIPVIFIISIHRLFKSRDRIDEEINRLSPSRFLVYIAPTIMAVILIYLVSGYFKYYAIAIVSGSMSPEFERGAVVIVDQHPKNIEVGDIIAYKKDDITIVHRVVNIEKIDKESFYYTKGDANKDKDKDNVTIKKNNIVGKVKLHIPFIGYPTVWLGEL